MKRVISIFMAVLSLCLMGCNKNIEKYDKYISELRSNLYIYESENLSVTAISGRRETPFSLDGVAGDMIEYTVITIEPTFVPGKEYRYKTSINDVEYSGSFLVHPFGKTLSCDIPVKCENQLITIDIISGEETITVQLASVVTENMINAETALSIALIKLKTQVESLKSGSDFNGEIYIRLTQNPIDNKGGYFWYVAFVSENDLTYAVLINPLTSEVVAVRD